MTKRRNKGPNVIIELDCIEDCNGACCKVGTGIFMNGVEVGGNLLKIQTKTLVQPRDEDFGPIKLTEKDEPFKIPAGYGFYELVQDCGHLTLEGACGVYEKQPPSRPGACNGLVAGTIACLTIRARSGFDDGLMGDTARLVAAEVADL